MVFTPVADETISLLRELLAEVTPAPWQVFGNLPDGSYHVRDDPRGDLALWRADRWSPDDHWGEVVAAGSVYEPVANNDPECARDPLDPHHHLIAITRNCLEALLDEVEESRQQELDPPVAAVMLDFLSAVSVGDEEAFNNGVAYLQRRWPKVRWLRDFLLTI